MSPLTFIQLYVIGVLIFVLCAMATIQNAQEHPQNDFNCRAAQSCTDICPCEKAPQSQINAR